MRLSFSFILLVISSSAMCQDSFERKLSNRIEFLKSNKITDTRYFELYPNDALQGIMIPSGWGGYGNYIYASIGGVYPQVYLKNAWDFGSGIGFCVGDPTKAVNFAASLSMNDISSFNNFSGNFSVSRNIGRGSSINVGVLGVFASEVQSDAPEASYFVAFSHSVQSLPSKTTYLSKLSYTIGIGNGRFLLKSGADSLAGKGKYGTAVFGGISYEILPHINVNAEWTGINLAVSVGARPFDLPFSVGAGITNLTRYSADKPNFIFSIGYAVSITRS